MDVHLGRRYMCHVLHDFLMDRLTVCTTVSPLIDNPGGKQDRIKAGRFGACHGAAPPQSSSSSSGRRSSNLGSTFTRQ